MADREKVIKAVDICRGNGHCEDCQYYQGHAGYTIMDCRKYLLNDVLALLKEQQERIETLEIDRDILVKDINTKNCNTCKRKCEHIPEFGDVVRVNCFMWEGR